MCSACSGEFENPYDLVLEEEVRDATCAPAASQKIDCDVCGKEASFIKNGRAFCYEHAFGVEKS